MRTLQITIEQPELFTSANPPRSRSSTNPSIERPNPTPQGSSTTPQALRRPPFFTQI